MAVQGSTITRGFHNLYRISVVLRLVAKFQTTGPAEFQVGDVIAIILTLLAHNVRLAPGQLQRNPIQAFQLPIWCREGGLTCGIVRR